MRHNTRITTSHFFHGVFNILKYKSLCLCHITLKNLIDFTFSYHSPICRFLFCYPIFHFFFFWIIFYFIPKPCQFSLIGQLVSLQPIMVQREQFAKKFEMSVTFHLETYLLSWNAWNFGASAKVVNYFYIALSLCEKKCRFRWFFFGEHSCEPDKNIAEICKIPVSWPCLSFAQPKILEKRKIAWAYVILWDFLWNPPTSEIPAKL